MGLFSKPQVVFLKESSSAKEQLQKLEELKEKARRHGRRRTRQ